MKSLVIPYAAQGNEWWVGIDFYNSDNKNSTALTIRIQRGNGTISRTMSVNILPLKHYLLTPVEIEKKLHDDKVTFLIECSDDVMITPFQGCTDPKGSTTGFGILPTYEVSSLGK